MSNEELDALVNNLTGADSEKISQGTKPTVEINKPYSHAKTEKPHCPIHRTEMVFDRGSTTWMCLEMDIEGNQCVKIAKRKESLDIPNLSNLTKADVLLYQDARGKYYLRHHEQLIPLPKGSVYVPYSANEVPAEPSVGVLNIPIKFDVIEMK